PPRPAGGAGRPRLASGTGGGVAAPASTPCHPAARRVPAGRSRVAPSVAGCAGNCGVAVDAGAGAACAGLSQSGRPFSGDAMSLAILNIGTAVPETIITQDDGLGLARAMIEPTPEQETWLPGMYGGTGIRTRHLAFDPQVIRDILDG